MVWVTRINATGKIHEMQGGKPPNVTKLLRANAINDKLLEADFTVEEMPDDVYKASVESAPEFIAAKLVGDEEFLVGTRKVLLSVLFDMANQIMALEGKNPITKKQFINNLKSRR